MAGGTLNDVPNLAGKCLIVTGANTGNLTAHLGAPRTVAASLSVVF